VRGCLPLLPCFVANCSSFVSFFTSFFLHNSLAMVKVDAAEIWKRAGPVQNCNGLETSEVTTRKVIRSAVRAIFDLHHQTNRRVNEELALNTNDLISAPSGVISLRPTKPHIRAHLRERKIDQFLLIVQIGRSSS
jgi:hypothetical protein